MRADGARCRGRARQAGFTLLCAGSVREKSTKSIILKNLLDVCAGAVAFFVVGYAFAFGAGNSFIGYSYFGLYFAGDDIYPEFFFQFAFVAAAATIVSGAMAERAKFVG